MKCPYCGRPFYLIITTVENIPDPAPFLCQGCAQFSLFTKGEIRKPTPEETGLMEHWNSIFAEVRNLALANRRSRNAVNN